MTSRPSQPQKFDPTPTRTTNASIEIDACVLAPRFHVRNTHLPSRNGNLNKVSIQRSTKRLVSKRVPSQYLSAGNNGGPDSPRQASTPPYEDVQSKYREETRNERYVLVRTGRKKQMFIWLNFWSMAATCALYIAPLTIRRPTQVAQLSVVVEVLKRRSRR